MATVSEVRLHLEPAGAGAWLVSSSYTVKFEPWERAAWFHERVRILGATSAGEVELAALTGPPFVPAPDTAGADPVTLQRRTPAVSLAGSALDVTPDMTFTAGRRVLTVHRPDHVFVRVAVVPLTPTAAEGRSPVHVRQFGIAEAAER